MEKWTMYGKPVKVEEKKSSIFQDYVLPIGALFIPSVSFLAQSNSPWWGSLAIAAYVVIVLIFLVVPAIFRVGNKVIAYFRNARLERSCLPRISASICRFKPLLESNRSDNIWGVWSNATRTSEAQKIIRPNHSHYYTLWAWLNHMQLTLNSSKTTDFRLILSEKSSWVQQYAAFCQEAYLQFEELLRSGQFNESQLREAKKSWNHARDEHNQALSNWKNLCSEINLAFDQNICTSYYETLKTLE